MSGELTHIDLFDQYLNNELTEAQKLDFERRIASDEEFKNEFSFYSDMVKGIDLAGVLNIEETVANVHQKLKSENYFSNDEAKVIPMKTAGQKSMFRRLSIAATVLILIVAGAYFFTSGGNGDKAFLLALQKPETTQLPGILDKLESFGLADSEKDQKDALFAALQQYEKTNYESAGIALLEYLKTYPDDQTAQLYLGLSLLHNKDYPKAIQYLEPLISNPEFQYLSTSKWYLALAYTQSEIPGATDNAVQLFKQLISDNTQYAAEALEILKAFE